MRCSCMQCLGSGKRESGVLGSKISSGAPTRRNSIPKTLSKSLIQIFSRSSSCGVGGRNRLQCEYHTTNTDTTMICTHCFPVVPINVGGTRWSNWYDTISRAIQVFDVSMLQILDVSCIYLQSCIYPVQPSFFGGMFCGRTGHQRLLYTKQT